MQSNMIFGPAHFFAGPNDEQEGGNCSTTHTGARPDHFGHGSVLRALCQLTYMLAKFRGNNISTIWCTFPVQKYKISLVIQI